MRVLVVANTYAEYMDWCSLRRVHPRAAVFVRAAEPVAPGNDDVVIDLRTAALSQNVEALQLPRAS
jgi:hypothetical protein